MWYRSGTVSVTNGSTAVTGSGTDWISGAGVGESFYGPDGRLYEIAAITSATTLTLGSVYLGATTSGQVYQIVPTQSYIRDLAAQAAQLVADYGNVVSNVGAGKFQDGTLAQPGLRFASDENTGIRRASSDELRLVAGGVDQARVSVAGLSVDQGKLVLEGASVANGVAYLNGSKQMVAGSGLVFDGANLLVGTSASSGLAQKTFEVNAETNCGVNLKAGNVSQGYLYADDASNEMRVAASGAGNSNSLSFYTGGLERARFSTSGNFGVGTTAPSARISAGYGVGLKVLAYDGDFAKSGLGVDLTGETNQINVFGGTSTDSGSLISFGHLNTTSNTYHERARIDSSGNLGLGVTPSAWASWYRSLDMLGGGTYASSDAAFLAVNGHNFFYNGSNYVYKANGSASMYTQGSANHAWHTAPSGTAGNAISFTQAMTLDASGNLLVGTTSALNSSRLTVWTAYAGNIAMTLMRPSSDVTGSVDLNFAQYNSSAASVNYGAVSSAITANTAGSHSGALVFQTSNAGTLAERARIDSSGNLLVGTTTFNSNSSSLSFETNPGTLKVSHVSGTPPGSWFVGFNYNGSGIGAITQNGTTAISYNTSSDYRLKNITGPVTNSGAYIDSLNPVEGTWKADGSTFVGLIAHEVQEASRTQVATGEKDGEQMQAMDYSNSELIANLIAEVKSLRARVARLESR